MKTTKLEFELPVEEDALPVSKAQINEILIGSLYAHGILTELQACEAMQYTRRELVQMLQRHHIPVGGYTADEDLEGDQRIYNFKA